MLAQKDSSSNDSELITDDENISVYRNVSHIENGEYLVSLKVEKGTFKSFGKIEEYIPEGFIASEGENQNGQFSFRNNVVKILWMTLPEENTLEVTYNLKSETDLLESVRVHGMFSYLNADQSEQIEMQASTFKNYYINESLPNEPIVEEAEISSSTDDSITSENEVIDIPEEIESNGEDALKEEIASDESENSNQLINDITNIPSPETSVTYKVQLAAGKKEVDQKYFVKVHNISEQVSIEYHESWYKYTIGKFDIYKQARDKRNEIWNKDNKINDAFVTAYNSGERITVQEALMISNQKWFK